MSSIGKGGCLTSKPSTVKGNLFEIFWFPNIPLRNPKIWDQLSNFGPLRGNDYQTCHGVVTYNRGLNNGLNTESSKVSIKGILGVLLWDDQDQWSEITPIIVDQMNWWILVQSGFISSLILIYRDPSDLRSLILIWIIAKERTHWLYHEWSCSFVKILLLVHLLLWNVLLMDFTS